jgi:hypothetical protein
MLLDVTEDETAAFARLLRRTIDEYRYPLSPRLILAKLEPPQPCPELPPLLNVYMAPSAGGRRRRG